MKDFKDIKERFFNLLNFINIVKVIIFSFKLNAKPRS